MKLQSILKSLLMLVCLYSITAGIFYLYSQNQSEPSGIMSDARFVIFVLMSPILFKYVLQLSLLPIYAIIERVRAKRHNLDSTAENLPKVSVLLPAWNEQVGIIKTIQSVLNSRYTKLEVIVINDGSTDNTDQLVQAFKKRYQAQASNSSIELKYLSLKNAGKASALNTALKSVTGDIVMTIDADCIMDKDAVAKMVQRFTDNKVGAVAGNVVVGNRRKPIELIQQLEYLYGFFFKRADSVLNSVYIIGGAAAAYRKDLLIKLGGFDHTIITEDIEMSMRILAEGYKTRYAADAIVYTEGPSDFKSLCNQRLRWKFGRLMTYFKHKTLFFNCSKKLNPYLTCILLPLALYVELALLLEVAMLAVFYVYTIYANDYLPLVILISFTSFMVISQIIFDVKSKFHLNLVLFAPVAWVMFYFVDLVELQALIRSIKRIIRRESLEWQKWVRVGMLSRKVSSIKPGNKND
jgi:poly-beta-1,6-N-acetyl-D-glucosamine synthase